MIAFTPEARRQVRALRDHYAELNRIEAIRGLRKSLAAAWEKIVTNPAAGLAAPRPYPHLVRPGRRWVKAGRYWVSYTTSPPLVIVAVFYEMADIPRRL